MDLTSDETDDDGRIETPSGEMQLQNLLDQLQTMQLQAPFASTRFRLSKSWTKTKNYFHPQRSLIAKACEYVGEKLKREETFSLKLLLFAKILKKSVGKQQKEETISKIAKQWSSLKVMITKHIESGELDDTIEAEMKDIMLNMHEYELRHFNIFNYGRAQSKTDITDNGKKSKSIKTQTKSTHDKISHHKIYDKLVPYSPERNRRKDHRKKEKRRTERYSDSDSTDSSSESSENETASKYLRKGGRKKRPQPDDDFDEPHLLRN